MRAARRSHRRDNVFRKIRIHASFQSNVGKGRRDDGARRARLARGEIVRGGFKKLESANVAHNPLISLKTAKENVWNFLGKSLEKLGFSLEKFGNPWKGLEKLGRAADPSVQRALIPNALARNSPP